MNVDACYKQGFPTAQAAHNSFRNLGKTISVYKCHRCKQWHASYAANNRAKPGKKFKHR